MHLPTCLSVSCLSTESLSAQTFQGPGPQTIELEQHLQQAAQLAYAQPALSAIARQAADQQIFSHLEAAAALTEAPASGSHVLKWLSAHRALHLPAQQAICQQVLQRWQARQHAQALQAVIAVDVGAAGLSRCQAAPWLQALDLSCFLAVCLATQFAKVQLYAYATQLQQVKPARHLAQTALRLRQAPVGWGCPSAATSQVAKVCLQQQASQLIVIATNPPFLPAVSETAAQPVWLQLCSEVNQVQLTQQQGWLTLKGQPQQLLAHLLNPYLA